ncbi:N-acetylmannosamine-6-phosphate 2-epimerase [Photobacterium sp. GB-72]|uniref:Putative N-acetylmannosamine-6-phosphate 2-epimerase n=2 Tax=Vibrionaceae TaxID=641 RepID=A0ABX5GY96_PHOAN|nr:N-acetylmannosamine-6-phosphate 2-epimerase [Photobacterium sp. GB-56]PSV32617.1 N-acetylmannosamine-6-phosphate 2-epimerase [Photobacterium sp. GB-72]PSV40267.1 N-acetylmannosamine-6-phosphate 2-epimerase [Photobacterium sp. GB-210]PSV58598.1 N-acetylmannosamine-6-phosphate 2-epimerase [Photobacterium sp. GB-3]PSX00743.1 N-acetylmannosamine-6-phosphate 2-epimerase [Photobacterium angustum]
MLSIVKNNLIVSCQALEDEPLHSSFIMGRMALAAKEGGASAIRANSPQDIIEIKQVTQLPVIGILKRDYDNSSIYITATMKEIDELMVANPDMIALDASLGLRPDGMTLQEMIKNIRQRYPSVLLMADIATLEEALTAQELGFDCVSTTLHGYTTETKGMKLYNHDFSFLRAVVDAVSIPVIAEGNVGTPAQAKRCLELGAYSVVVGGAITRPKQITTAFIDEIKMC